MEEDHRSDRNAGVEVGKRGEASPGEGRAGILSAAKSSLSVFALVVLIAESVLGIATPFSPLSESHKFTIDILLIALLFFVIMVVGVITFFRPGGLSPEMAEAVKQASNISADVQKFINDQSFKDSIADIVEESVKPEALKGYAAPKRLEGRDENADQ